jgi:hypothetical protein
MQSTGKTILLMFIMVNRCQSDLAVGVVILVG